MSDREPPASGRRTERPAAASVDEKAVPSWRRRFYRVPVIGTIAYIVWPPRTGAPSVWRRAISWTAAVVAILGIGMAAYPFAGEQYPFFYKVPVEKLIEWSNVLSDLETNRIQDRLEDEFLALGDPAAAKDGDPLTRIEMPTLGVNTIVVQGTSLRALAAGAGHYPTTPLPGQKGNVAIAGHRTTHGRPFNKIEQLKPGDPIYLTTPAARYVYQVQPQTGGVGHWITTPYDWSVVGPSSERLLTLTACHPKGSARQRIIVRAKMIRTDPPPAAKAA